MREHSGESAQEQPLSMSLAAKGGRRRRRGYGHYKGKRRNLIPKGPGSHTVDAAEPEGLEEVPRFASSNFNQEESTPLSMSLVGKGGRRRRRYYGYGRRRSYYGRSKGKSRNLIPKHVEEEVLEDVPRSTQQLMSMMSERSGSAR